MVTTIIILAFVITLMSEPPTITDGLCTFVPTFIMIMMIAMIFVVNSAGA